MEGRGAPIKSKSTKGARRINPLRDAELRRNPLWFLEDYSHEDKQKSRIDKDELRKEEKKKPKSPLGFFEENSSIHTTDTCQPEGKKGKLILENDSDDEELETDVAYVSVKQRTGNAIPWYADPEEKYEVHRIFAKQSYDCHHNYDETGDENFTELYQVETSDRPYNYYDYLRHVLGASFWPSEYGKKKKQADTIDSLGGHHNIRGTNEPFTTNMSPEELVDFDKPIKK